MVKNNRINGTLNIGSGYSKQLQLIDLQNNNIDEFSQRAGYSVQSIILAGNPICDVGKAEENYCTIPNQPNSSYSTPAKNCTPHPCNSNLEIPSPTCECAIPYSGNLYFRAPSFSNFGNHTLFRSLVQKMMDSFISYGQPVDSVSVGNPTQNVDNYLLMSLQVFPSGQQYFNRAGIVGIGFTLSNQTFKPPHEFGPYYFIGEKYPLFIVVTERSYNSSSKTVIIGAAVGGSLVVLLSLIAGVYAFRQKRRATRKSNPFASWDCNSDSGGVPQFKEVRRFSFEEIKKCTNNFSETNCVGSGGYGKVYRGTLPDGQLVAIKRAEQGSMQGRLEFKTEIELLSRVHHKNVVGLVGFCFDRGEQMLVYEFITNGTLKDSLAGKTTTLDWMRRLRIALGAARGLQYLHDLANPPIIHRDIKSNNILLDEHLNAKVADFGLSKPMGEPEKSFVITQVKGTVGYMDPEYYTTQRLSAKSDVYSFGVLLLEILTSRTPILKGKYIVNEVKEAMDKTKNLYNLDAIVDPIVASNMAPQSVERFVDLALRCVEGSGPNRPSMGEVVKEMENIMQMAGLNSNAESASTSDNYGVSKGCGYPHDSLFSQGGHYSTTVLEGR